jgi:hypothetical protein
VIVDAVVDDALSPDFPLGCSASDAVVSSDGV